MSVQEIKNLLTKLKGLVAEEKADEAAGLFSGIERQVVEIGSDRHEANEESKKRKERIRELEQEKADLEDKYNQLKESKTGHDEEYQKLKAEKEKLDGVVSTIRTQQREAFGKWYTEHKEKPGFDKVKDRLHIPDEKDGKIDWSAMSDDDLLSNQDEIDRANDYGIFTKESGSPPKGGGGAGGDVKSGRFTDDQFK